MKRPGRIWSGAIVAALVVAPLQAQTTATGGDAAPPAAAHHPIADFAAPPFMERPRLSPNGKLVATQISVGGAQKLAILDVSHPTSGSALINFGDDDLDGWQWVNDDWLVATVTRVEHLDGNDRPVTLAVGISADGRKTVPVGTARGISMIDRIIWTAHDGSPRILVQLRKSLYYTASEGWPLVAAVDVSTGKEEPIVAAKAGIFRWYADGAGQVRMGVGYSSTGNQERLLYRPNNSAAFRTIDRAKPNSDTDDLTIPAMFLPDPNKAIIFDDSGGYDALYALDLTTLQRGERIFGVAGFDLDGFMTNQAGTALAGVYYTDTRDRVHWFDAEMAQIQAQLDGAVGTRQAEIVSTSADRSRLLVRVVAPDHPGLFYIFDRSDGAMRMFAREHEAMGKNAVGVVRTVTYKARDGMPISAVLTLPAGRPAEKLPLVLLPHGGPSARDQEQWDWWVQFLADRGYAVFQPNYRGSTGFGNAFEKAGEGQWGLAMQDDLNDGVDWLAAQGIIDADRVCVAGASYGGYAAFRAAQRDGKRFRCAISYAGVADLNAMKRYDSQFLNNAAKEWRKMAPDLRNVSPINFPEQFSTPLLVMHGAKDKRVPVKQSRTMVAALNRAGKTVTYIEQPLGDHHFSRQEDRLQFLTEMEAFLARYNPA